MTSCARCSQKYHPLWINLHFNHPNEITPEVSRAVDKLTKAGLPVGNQSVLLAGVNDCVHIQRALVHKLVANRIRPYYLYQCDLVEGSGHFRTPVGKGLEIMEGLRGHTSGLCGADVRDRRARWRRQDPGHAQLPDQLLATTRWCSATTRATSPRTRSRRRYQQHDKAACIYCQNERPEPGQSGVLGLLQGERMWIEPHGLRGHPRARQHRGAPPPGPVQVGPVRRRGDRGQGRRGTARTGGRGRGGPRPRMDTPRVRNRVHAKANQRHQPTGSCFSCVNRGRRRRLGWDEPLWPSPSGDSWTDLTGRPVDRTPVISQRRWLAAPLARQFSREQAGTSNRARLLA